MYSGFSKSTKIKLWIIDKIAVAFKLDLHFRGRPIGHYPLHKQDEFINIQDIL